MLLVRNAIRHTYYSEIPTVHEAVNTVDFLLALGDPEYRIVAFAYNEDTGTVKTTERRVRRLSDAE